MRPFLAPRRHEIGSFAAIVAVATTGIALTACGVHTTRTPEHTTPPPAVIAVEQLAQTSAAAPCQWVAVTSDLAHAIPSDLDTAAGRVEQKSCGAPEGDTTGMGGPVEWRVVPTS